MIKYLLFFAIIFNAIATEKIKDNELKVGKADSQDVKITINNGAANLPYLLYDWSEGKWKQSNDGTTEEGIGGDTVLTTDGDLLYFGSGSEQRLAIGGEGEFLSVSSGLPAWTSIVTSPITTEGDLQIGDATGSPVRLPIGAVDYLLTSNGTTASWQPAPVSTTLSAKAQLQSFSTVNEAVPAPTANGQYLVSDDTQNTGMKWDDSILAQVGQAQFVGSVLYRQTGCVINATGTANTWLVPPLDSQCVNPTVEGGLSGNNRMQITIPNARTDGYYKVTRTGLLDANTNAGQCRLTLSSTTSYDNQGTTATNQADAKFSNNISGSFKFDTGGNKTISLLYYATTSNVICSIYGTDNADLASKYIVEFFPDSSQLVAFQETELTAQTANEFSARISSTGVVSQENYDFINGDCVITDTSLYTCTLNNLNISNSLNCAIGEVSANRSVFYTSGTSSQLVFRTRQTTTDVNSSATFGIVCSKHGTDVNKTQVVAGVFENINSSPTVRVEAVTNDGQSITAGDPIAWKTERVDNYGAWDGDTFTAPFDGWYMVTATIFTDVLPDNTVFLVDTTDNEYAVKEVDGTNKIRHTANKIFYMDKNDTMHIDANDNITLRASTVSHTITIASLPDYEAIVKNLNDNNNIECQTKFLNSDITADSSDITDLKFNNLTVGKNYYLTSQVLMRKAASGSPRLDFTNNGNVIARAFNTSTTGEAGWNTFPNAYFVAEATTVITQLSGGASTTISGDGSRVETFATLCELPDNYIIDSTKFN